MSPRIESLEGRALLSAAPDARFVAYQFSSHEFHFDASRTRPLASITKFIWHFGDGKTGKGQFVAHTFPKAGTYRVKVSAYDASGGRDDYGLNYVVGSTTKTASISGLVFNDANYNAARNKGEAVVQTPVYIDANNNSQLDSGERVAIDDPFGGYAFLNLKAGTYTVRLAKARATDAITIGSAGYRFSVANGQASPGHLFGQAAGSTISGGVKATYGGGKFAVINSGTAYIDLNRNGKLDALEPTATVSNGTFSFTGLVGGTYAIRMQPYVSQVVQSSPSNNGAITVKVGYGSTANAGTFIFRHA